MHSTVLAVSLAFFKAPMSSDIRMAMTTRTTSNSTSVKFGATNFLSLSVHGWWGFSDLNAWRKYRQ